MHCSSHILDRHVQALTQAQNTERQPSFLSKQHLINLQSTVHKNAHAAAIHRHTRHRRLGTPHRVRDDVEVDGALVARVPEEVVRRYRRVAALLAAKDEVDPRVQVPLHVRRLERSAVLPDEVGRVARPRRQLDVCNLKSGKTRLELPKQVMQRCSHSLASAGTHVFNPSGTQDVNGVSA
jgi:hypothetical protein